jgi:predicted nucleic acid-binding protein
MVYVDANVVISSVEKHPLYGPLLLPLWQAAQAKTIEVVSSELVLLEVLIGPLRNGDAPLANAYEQLFFQPQTRLLPITLPILKEAARLRALFPGLKTPDAVHAATGLLSSCTMFLSNDPGFRRVPTLPVVILDDVMATP